MSTKRMALVICGIALAVLYGPLYFGPGLFLAFMQHEPGDKENKINWFWCLIAWPVIWPVGDPDEPKE